jgi:hypothetical protein
MKRLAILGVLAAALLAAPAPALAGRPNIYHSISVTMASAYFTVTEGCVQTEAWISATDGRWASQGGGVDTAGDLALSVRVVDTCASAGIRPMAGGGAGTVLYDGFGRIDVPLASSPRLEWASTAGSIELVDQLDGGITQASVAITWTGGPLSHDTTRNNHSKCADGECARWMPDFDVLVNTHDNNLRREATATIELVVGGNSILMEPSSDAVVERVKSACMEIPKGTFAGDSDYCF